MANAYVVNQTPTGYGAGVSLLVEMLVSAGWTYKASGDGLAGYNATGKVFTGTIAGALGWNNAKAWARLADPVGGREFIFQHDAAGGARIKYSKVAKFTGGTPSAVITPSATDERYLRGAATDAAPSYGAGWFNTTYQPTAQVKFQGGAIGTAPYAFWFCGALIPVGTITTGIMMDAVTSVPEDPDPVVLHCASTGAFGDGMTAGSANTDYRANGGVVEGCWGYMDTALAQFLAVNPCGYWAGQSSQAGLTGGAVTGLVIGSKGLSQNPFNAKYELLPVPYVRSASSASLPFVGLKGWSQYMRWTSVQRTNFTDTIANRQWICVNRVWLPWDGTSIPTN